MAGLIVDQVAGRGRSFADPNKISALSTSRLSPKPHNGASDIMSGGLVWHQDKRKVKTWRLERTRSSDEGMKGKNKNLIR